jgi:hypothetical protein
METNRVSNSPGIGFYLRAVVGTWGQHAVLIALAAAPLMLMATVFNHEGLTIPGTFALISGAPFYLVAACLGGFQAFTIFVLRHMGGSPSVLAGTLIGGLPIFAILIAYWIAVDGRFIDAEIVPATLVFGTVLLSSWRLARRLTTHATGSQALAAVTKIALSLLLVASLAGAGIEIERNRKHVEAIERIRSSPQAAVVKDLEPTYIRHYFVGPMGGSNVYELYFTSPRPVGGIESDIIALGYETSGERMPKHIALARLSDVLTIDGQTLQNNKVVPGPGAEGRCFYKKSGNWSICVYDTLASPSNFALANNTVSGNIIALEYR